MQLAQRDTAELNLGVPEQAGLSWPESATDDVLEKGCERSQLAPPLHHPPPSRFGFRPLGLTPLLSHKARVVDQWARLWPDGLVRSIARKWGRRAWSLKREREGERQRARVPEQTGGRERSSLRGPRESCDSGAWVRFQGRELSWPRPARPARALEIILSAKAENG